MFGFLAGIVSCVATAPPRKTRETAGRVKPHLMITDPPYGVNYDPAWRKRAGVNLNARKLGKVANDDRADWREAWALFPGSVAYVWHAGRHTSEVQQSLEASGFDMRSQIIGPRTGLPLAAAIIIGSTSPVGMRSGEQPGRTGVGTASNRHFGISTRVTTTGTATERRSPSSACGGL